MTYFSFWQHHAGLEMCLVVFVGVQSVSKAAASAACQKLL